MAVLIALWLELTVTVMAPVVRAVTLRPVTPELDSVILFDMLLNSPLPFMV